MFNNKKGQAFVTDLISWILIFSLTSVIFITIAIINYGVINDYAIYNLQEISEQLEQDGVLKPGFSNITQEYGDSFTNFNFHWDDLWFLAYAIFVILTLISAYQSRQQNYFGFLAYLFYGIMFILFLLTVFETITNWFKNNILLAITPNIILTLPKFYFYLDNIGIFSAIHIVICLIINLVDFDITKIVNRKKQEQITTNDDEIV